MNILSTQVSLRNDSVSSIVIGSLTILSGNSVLIWDTVNYTINTDNFKQIVDNIAVFNENIGNGNLVMVIDTVDQSSSEAWSNYKEFYLTFNREDIEKRGFSVLRLGEEETKGLVISHSDLIDLTNDDHSQYLLTNGDRSLTGNLDIGGNDITGVGLVDGVDVSVLDGYVSGLINNNQIMKDPTGFTNPEGIIINYNSTNRTITLTGDVEAYYQGELIIALTSGWVSDAHPDITGVTYFLYYNGINFIWSTTVWSFDYLQIAAVYFGINSFCLRECHGLMQWQVHRELHQTIGTYLFSGGDLSNYILNSTTVADRRPFISETKLADEDLITTLPFLSTNSYTWLYLTGADVSTTSIGNTDIINLLGNQPYYNQFTGGAWQQTLFSNNEYAKIFVIGVPVTSDTGSQSIRYLFLQPQQISSSLSIINALSPSSVNLGTIGSSVPEYNFFAEIVIRYQGGNWFFVSVSKLTGTRVSQVSSPAGSYLSFVSVDGTTITGDGTSGSPLVANISNLVVGPSTATDNAIARFDLATGKLIQDSVVLVGDTGIITGVSTINGVTVETHASRHNPGGADALSLGTPSTLVVGGSNSAGTATSFVRSDHIHALPAFGTASGTFCQGNDLRLSDDRTASGLRTATTVVSISGATAPTTGQILKATSSTTATWQNDNAGTGDVVGPSSSTDNAIARFDSTTGKLIQDSNIIIDDNGNLYLNANGSSTTTPRVLGAVNFSSGEAIRWEFGDAANAIQNSNGGAMTVYSYHTLILQGNRSTTTPAGFVTTSNIGVYMPSANIADPHVVLTGISGQTGDLQQWRDSTESVMLSVDASGNIVMAGAQTVDGVDVSTHASRHNPGGTDALALGTPSTLVVGGSNSAGTATSFVRSDHIHALPAFGTASETFCQGNDLRLSDDRTASGLRTATTVVSISGATAPTVGQVLIATSSTAATWQTLSSGAGDVVGPSTATDNAIARFDLATGKLIQDSVVLVGDTGIITGVSTINGVTVETHASRHNPGGADALATAVPATTAVQVGNTASIGTATSFSRSDHIHTVTAGTPVNVTKATATEGTAVTFSRSDHKHDITTAAPSNIGTANSEGNATSLARSNHVHAHGNQTVGTLHAAVSSTTNGFMVAVGAVGTIAQSTGTTAAWVSELTNPQKVAVRKNTGTNIGSRPRLNFIEGSNVTLTIADDVTDNEVDITINSTASGTGDVVGPATSTDNAIARFNLATGKLIQNSVVLVGDTGIITGVSTINGVTVETHASRHNPGGADALALGTPSTLVVGGSNSAGTATSFVRSDHIHALPAFGTASGTFCQGNDLRLSDDRTASGLRTATTVVSISGATAPTVGQALIATSSTAATWQAVSGSSKKTVIVEYTLTDDTNNTIDWFTTWRGAGGDTATQKKSGANNGIQNQNSCSPFVVPFNATITKAVLVLKGAGVQNGSVTYPVVYQTDLYLESFSSESKLADIDFSISNLYTVGTYSPGDTHFTGSTTLSISVNEGNMLALKFINGTGASVVGQSRNAFIVLVLEEV